MRWLTLMFALAACNPATPETGNGGTSVGNPNMARMRVSVAPTWFFYIDEASFPVREVSLDGCDGTMERWDVDVDVLAPDVVLEAPPLGSWCTQDWIADENVILSGYYRGVPFRYEIESPEVGLSGEWQVDAQASYVLEIGEPGWLRAFGGPLVEGKRSDIEPGDELHDALRDTFETGAALFLDADGDGELGNNERAVGAVAWGPGRDPDREGGGGGA